MNRIFPTYVGGPCHGESIKIVENGRRDIKISILDDFDLPIGEYPLDAQVPFTEHIYELQQTLVLDGQLLAVWALSTMDKAQVYRMTCRALLNAAGCFHE